MNDDNELMVVNLTQPTLQTIKVAIEGGQMIIDVQKLKIAADELGADKYDVLSIGGFRNSKGEFVPDYDTVRIEKRNE